MILRRRHAHYDVIVMGIYLSISDRATLLTIAPLPVK